MQIKRNIIPANVKTKLDEMNLLDRFLFSETVEDTEVYNAMVEILLDGHISMLSWSETEKELRVSPQLREIRLDIIGMDVEKELYQVEMQKNNTHNLPKRSRFYQGQIDVSLLEPGCVDFNKLNDLTTILVAPFDIFGYGLYRYTFEEYCQEVPALKLEDGARRIFINTKGNNPENFSQEFLDFMEYINATTDEVAAKSESRRIHRIHARVRSVKNSEKVGVKLMQQWEELIYERTQARIQGREEGREEGRKEGREEGRKEGRVEGRKEGRAEGREEGRTEGEIKTWIRFICHKLRQGLSVKEIAEDLGEEETLILQYCEAADAYAPKYDEQQVWEAYQKRKNKVH